MHSVKHTEISIPKGPNGEKLPADLIGLAVMIGKIATGNAEDSQKPKSSTFTFKARAPDLQPKLLQRQQKSS